MQHNDIGKRRRNVIFSCTFKPQHAANNFCLGFDALSGLAADCARIVNHNWPGCLSVSLRGPYNVSVSVRKQKDVSFAKTDVTQAWSLDDALSTCDYMKLSRIYRVVRRTPVTSKATIVLQFRPHTQ